MLARSSLSLRTKFLVAAAAGTLAVLPEDFVDSLNKTRTTTRTGHNRYIDGPFVIFYCHAYICVECRYVAVTVSFGTAVSEVKSGSCLSRRV